MIITGSPIINLLCFVLWRITLMVQYMASEPPMAEIKKSVFSGTLFALRFAWLLSIQVTVTDIREMIAK